ncbi:hypothetical protein ABPG74_021499 [Tetrahymena malaccensis]
MDIISTEYLIKRIRTSSAYFYFSLVQLVLCLSVLTYVLTDPYNHLQNPIVLWLEAIIAVIILIDIIIRMVAEKRMYFQSGWNIFDLVSFIVIVVVLSIFYSAELNQELTEDEENEDIIGLVLIATRYIVQIIRIILMIRKSHQTRQIHQNAAQDFNLQSSIEKSTGQEQSIVLDKQYCDQIKQFSSNHSLSIQKATKDQ